MKTNLRSCELFQDATNDENLDACLSKNSKNLGQCILDCNDDTNCEATCVTAFKKDHSECPCQVFKKYSNCLLDLYFLGEVSVGLSMR